MEEYFIFLHALLSTIHKYILFPGKKYSIFNGKSKFRIEYVVEKKHLLNNSVKLAEKNTK